MYSKFRTYALPLLVLMTLSFVCTSGQAKGTILVFGDSISAAYGMDAEQGWVNLLAGRVAELGLDCQVINASVSGETTGGGVVRLPKTLEFHQPELVILELGGNDGLRGYPIDKIQENLTDMVTMILDQRAQTLLIGMILPPNYGRRYTLAFERQFAEVAVQTGVPLVAHLLDGAATDPSLLQLDGIHPRPEAQPRILDDIWPYVESMLDESSSCSRSHQSGMTLESSP
ncbi:MAG: arylesterase [Proteobacteria bacterium]|nr:arylesterase [Pseudomonadota bacterium]